MTAFSDCVRSYLRNQAGRMATGIWCWAPLSEDAPEQLFHDPSNGTWWAMAQDGIDGPMCFFANNIHEDFGKRFALLRIRYTMVGLPPFDLATGRIDVDRDTERLGLARSAVDQLRHVGGMEIPLQEMRRLLDEFVFDVMSEQGQAGGTQKPVWER